MSQGVRAPPPKLNLHEAQRANPSLSLTSLPIGPSPNPTPILAFLACADDSIVAHTRWSNPDNLPHSVLCHQEILKKFFPRHLELCINPKRWIVCVHSWPYNIAEKMSWFCLIHSHESFISVTLDSSEPIHPFRCQKFSTSIFIVPFQCFRSSVWYNLKLKVSILSRTSDHCHMHWLQRCSLLPPGMEKLSWSVKWGVWFRIAFWTIHFSQTSRKLD